MPVTKTAKRALRSSKKKGQINSKVLSTLEIAIRAAKKSPTAKNTQKVISLTDRAAKSKVIHKNKADRIKKAFSKKMPVVKK
ncbi:MAG: 30S ribosomal protein S20 [Candidatus Microgenomates bacterium]|jgi:ribosomal protein S20